MDKRRVGRHALALLVVAALAACGDRERPVDETATVNPLGFGCLDRVDEVADDPLHPAPPPYCRIAVLSGLTLDRRPAPVTAVLDRGSECARTAEGFAIDLAPGVAARFHAAFQAEPDWVPLEQSAACPAAEASGPVPPLPGGAAAVLEFSTLATVRAPAAAGGVLVLPAAVEVRLVEAGSGRQLWRDTCRTDTAELQAAASFPGFGNLRQLLSDEALRCAQGFAAALGAPPPI
mgnify:CR=1 FL=1